MGFFKEFREFALRGNVMDMAVGVIIGGAFQKIVTSLVGDVLMPPLGQALSLGGKAMSFKDQYLELFSAEQAQVLPPGYTLADIQKANLPVLLYGSFLSTLFDFVILALCVFVMVKIMNLLIRRKTEAPTPPAPSTSEKLLTEIRDALLAGR